MVGVWVMVGGRRRAYGDCPDSKEVDSSTELPDLQLASLVLVQKNLCSILIATASSGI